MTSVLGLPCRQARLRREVSTDPLLRLPYQLGNDPLHLFALHRSQSNGVEFFHGRLEAAAPRGVHAVTSPDWGEL